MPQPPDSPADGKAGLQPDNPFAASADRRALDALRFASAKHGLPDPATGRAFVLGDVVALKSGGPLMTVVAVMETRIKAMYWNDGFAVDEFPTACLRHHS